MGSSFFGDGADVGDGECYVCCGHGGGLFTESVGTPFAGSEQVLSTGELDALHQMQLATVEELPEVSPSDQTQHRLRHLEALRAAGMERYPLGGDKGGTSISVLGVRDALSIFSSINIPDSEFIVSGRVRTLCKHSGVLFITLVEKG